MSNLKNKKLQQQNRIKADQSPIRPIHQKTNELANIDINSVFNASTHPHQKESIPYFKNNHYQVHLESKSPKTPQKLTSNQASSPNRMQKIQELLKDISKHRQEMKDRVEQLKWKENEESLELQQCTFNPRIRRNPRYHIRSTLEDRNKSWDEARVKHYTSIKQELVEQEVKECTFNPNMIAFTQSKRILKNKELRENMAKEMEQDARHHKPLVEAKFEKITSQVVTKEKKTDAFDFRLIRKMLKDQMNRMKLQF